MTGAPTERKLLYIAHPFTASSDEEQLRRLRSATHVLEVAATWGVPVYSPITHLARVGVLRRPLGADRWFEHDEEVYYAHGLAMLERCDALVVVEHPGWEMSTGVALEVEAARRAGMPVHHLDGRFVRNITRSEHDAVRELAALLQQWSNTYRTPRSRS